MPALRRAAAIVEALVDGAGRLAAWTGVVLVLLVAGNVLARYLFRAGTIWLQELEWHLISPIALLGMAYALLRDQQVRVDVVFERLPPRARDLIETATGLLLAAFAVIVVRLSLPFVDQAYRVGEGSPNPGGLDHRFLLKAFIPLGFALLALQGGAHALRHALRLWSGR